MYSYGVFMYSAACLTLPTVLCLPVLPYSVHVPEISSNQNSRSYKTRESGVASDGSIPIVERLISSPFRQTNRLFKDDVMNSGIKNHKPSFSGAPLEHASVSSAQLPLEFSANLDTSHGSISSQTGESPLSHNAHSSNTISTSSNSRKTRKHLKNVVNNALSKHTARKFTKNSDKLQYQHDRLESVENKVLQENHQLNSRDQSGLHRDVPYQEYAMPSEHVPSVQLAVKHMHNPSEGSSGDSEMVVTVGTALAALFCLGLILGLFGCCCPKKQAADGTENSTKNNGEVTGGDRQTVNNKLTTGQSGGQLTADNKKPSQVFNPSDIPAGEEDLDDPVSVKDKIRALDQKLLIKTSPDPNKRKSQNNDLDVKRRSQNDLDLKRKSQNNDLDFFAKRKSQNRDIADDKALLRQPLLTPDDDVILRDKTDQSRSRSLADNISKSDTQDDVSDKIFDNISTHSSLSQPNNPDVVIADTDDDDEFAQLQRGTVILKSFQRAKPPRNRSPATRTSKGKIRKSRANLDSSQGRDSPSSGPNSRDPSKDRDHTSTPSSLSVGTSSKTNSLETKLDKSCSKNSPDAASENSAANERRMETSTTGMDDFLDFDSIMNKSVTSIGSDIVIQKKHESPTSVRYTKKDSPKSDRDIRNGSPGRNLKTKESETKEKGRTESPSRFKKNKDSPIEKRKYRRKEREKEFKHGHSEAMSTSLYEAKEEKPEEKRLSGIPAGMNNNIFYLIDPTVKKKCKSVENILADKKQKRKSGDYNNEAPKGSKHKAKEEKASPTDSKSEESGSPVKRDRTQSDPSRKKGVVEQTPL